MEGHFFRHGFEVVNMVQAVHNPFPEIRARHSQKLENYCQKELATSEVSLWLRKPAAPSNLEEFLVRAPQ
jgi:head-tail adaptor